MGCSSCGGGGSGTPGAAGGSDASRWQVISPNGVSVTYWKREDAERHARVRGGEIREVRPGQRRLFIYFFTHECPIYGSCDDIIRFDQCLYVG